MMTLEDRLAADTFGKSYREFLELKPTHIRWSRLAPQSLVHLGECQERKWSMEKLADYLGTSAEDAEACFRRFVMSKKVNAKETTAARIRQGFFEWTARFGDDEKERERWAGELALVVANQLHAAALAKEELPAVAAALEGVSTEVEAKPQVKPQDEPRRWGPQWKD